MICPHQDFTLGGAGTLCQFHNAMDSIEERIG